MPVLPLDRVEPWTGEDLAPVLAAMERRELDLDRIDPWNGQSVPYEPTHWNAPPDRDPWAMPGDRPARVHAKKVAPLDTTPAWGSPGAGAAAASDDGTTVL